MMRALLTATSIALLFSTAIAAQLKKEASAVDKADPIAPAIARGVGYLSKEVPKWKAEHPCYSCHNNGDATRAMLVAGAKGYDIGTSLDDTLAFLKQPAKWDQNKAPDGFDDKRLARVQFASALAVAERHGKAASTDVDQAAKQLVADQQADGSWTLDQSQSIASPATYGPIIATWSARTTLISSGMQPDNFTIVQADRWFRGLAPENVIDAAGTLLGLDLASDVMADNLRRTCLSIIRNGQSPEGGGDLRHRQAAGVRHSDGGAGLEHARCGTAAGAIDLPPRRTQGSHQEGQGVSRVAAASRWQLARNHAARRPGKLRATHLDDRLGDARATHPVAAVFFSQQLSFNQAGCCHRD